MFGAELECKLLSFYTSLAASKRSVPDSDEIGDEKNSLGPIFLAHGCGELLAVSGQ